MIPFFQYSSSFWVKVGLTAFAMGIALFSLWYSHDLVVKIADREKKLIDLYAKGLESAAKSDNSGGNLSFLFKEIIQANTSVPVILATSDSTPVSYKNLDLPDTLQGEALQQRLKAEMEDMASYYTPLQIEIMPGMYNYIYYRNSDLLQQLKYYPYVQLVFICLFVLLGYLVLNNTLRNEQNHVWVGMAKETAHQLGTPISSLMAWNELLKSNPDLNIADAVAEMEKDLLRLETVTSRFSQIGSKPVLKPMLIKKYIEESLTYLKTRISGKIQWKFEATPDAETLQALLNKPLMDWTLENIIKNAADAMDGKGTVTVALGKTSKNIYIDITDTGKGLKREQFKQIFKPGYTTKQRGWGLGLSLAKRIVEAYHGGKIFVKTSEPHKGTTFRILLKII